MAAANLPIRFRAEILRSIAFGSISGTYAGVGLPLANPCRQFKIDNLTDALMIFSIDGVNDHFVVPSNGFFLNDVSSNTSQYGGFYIAQGDRLYVRQASSAPTSGSVYFSVFYGSV